MKDKNISWDNVHWLVGFLDQFEKPRFDLGHWKEKPTSSAEGLWQNSPTIEAFIMGFYERGLFVEFHWMKWEYGKKLWQEPERIYRVNGLTCLKLLTMHLRADHFTPGHFRTVFEEGQITIILQRLKVLLGNQGGKAFQQGRSVPAGRPSRKIALDYEIIGD